MRIIQPGGGQHRWVHAISTGFYNPRGKLSFVNGIIMDITGRKRAQEALEVYRRKLRALAQELSRVEERQRRRIAMDLHDGVGQLLAAAKIKRAEVFADPELSEINDVFEELLTRQMAA